MLSYCVSCHSSEQPYGIKSPAQSWSRCHKNSKQSKSDPRDPSGSAERVMYRASNLYCIFHKTNNSQEGQDVVATPRTTTLIYTRRAQAETDVDDLKMEICREKIRWEKKFPVGLYPFRMDGWCLFRVCGWCVLKSLDSMS